MEDSDGTFYSHLRIDNINYFTENMKRKLPVEPIFARELRQYQADSKRLLLERRLRKWRGTLSWHLARAAVLALIIPPLTLLCSRRDKQVSIILMTSVLWGAHTFT